MKLTFPWLSDDYVSDWARTVQPGAGKDRGWTVLPEVGDEVLVAFEQGDFSRPNVLGGLFNGVDTMATGQGDLVDGGTGAVRRRSMVSRRGHRIDLLDADGQTEGVRLATKDDKLLINLDHVGTTITVHADGKVLVEGSQGITIDASSAAMELKGGSIALKATNGVTRRRRRRGRVGQVRRRPLAHRHDGQARGQRHHRGQGRRDVLRLRRPGQDQLSWTLAPSSTSRTCARNADFGQRQGTGSVRVSRVSGVPANGPLRDHRGAVRVAVHLPKER